MARRPASGDAGRRRGRWGSFVADCGDGERPVRALHEAGNARHRLRVEYDRTTLLIHLSGEDGEDWTAVAVDRASRRWAVAQGPRQADTAREAYEHLYLHQRGGSGGDGGVTGPCLTPAPDPPPTRARRARR